MKTGIKKLVSLSILLTIGFWGFGTWNLASSAGFTDVPSSHPNYQAILYVQSEGIVKGYDDGTFKPDQPINRAEFTKILIEAVFSDQNIRDCIKGVSFLFHDVNRAAWFAKYVCLAKNLAIIKGYADGNFLPTNNINFAEAAKIIIKTLGIPTNPGDPWFQPFVDKLAENNAVPSSIKSSQQFITRGEMAEIIYRLRSVIEQIISTGSSDTSSSSNTSTAQATIEKLKQEVIDAVNQERAKEEIAPLRYSTFLEQSSQIHSDDMENRDYFEHNTPEGITPNDRIEESGYLNEFNSCNCNKSYLTAENIAIGQLTSEEVMETWMNSALHRLNIMNPKFTEIGIGMTKITDTNMGNYQGYFWVQNFGDVTLE